MNTPSPLVPQGAIPSREKSTVFFKVFMILTVHVVLIGGMLMQGCKKTEESAVQPTDATPASTASNDTVPPVASTAGMSNAISSNGPQTLAQNPAPTPQPMPSSAPVPQPIPQPVPAPVSAVPVASTETHEYVIAAHDTLGAIAKKNGVSLKAILAANPGVDPKKLKVGQKVQIPAGAPATGTPDAAAGDTTTYTVKTGDTLGKIAKANHTTFKKLMALNDLKTTSIKIGQKLKLPAGSETPAGPAAVLTTTPPAATTAAAVPPSTTASN
jgi:peptidoglycan DL-endopeptidase LytF